MTTVSGGALGQRFVGGSQGVVKRLAQDVEAEVHLRATVRRVEHHADHVKVGGDGFEAVGRYVVIAIPLPLAARVEYDPVLPPRRDQLTQRMPLGSAIKYLVLYDEPFWREDGLSGTVISHNSPIRAVMDGSPPDHRPGVLTGFVTGPAARTLALHDEAQRRSVVVRELVRFFGPKAGRPREFFEQNWMAEPFTRGCYHGYAPPGLYTQFGQALREPIGRIHWAGAESAPLEYGSMSGAIHSGIRAAGEVVEQLAMSRTAHAA
jgi:monoamine oxidase